MEQDVHTPTQSPTHLQFSKFRDLLGSTLLAHLFSQQKRYISSHLPPLHVGFLTAFWSTKFTVPRWITQRTRGEKAQQPRQTKHESLVLVMNMTWSQVSTLCAGQWAEDTWFDRVIWVRRDLDAGKNVRVLGTRGWGRIWDRNCTMGNQEPPIEVVYLVSTFDWITYARTFLEKVYFRRNWNPAELLSVSTMFFFCAVGGNLVPRIFSALHNPRNKNWETKNAKCNMIIEIAECRDLRGKGRGGGALIILLGENVPPGAENPYPISDQNIRFFLFQTRLSKSMPYFRPCAGVVISAILNTVFYFFFLRYATPRQQVTAKMVSWKWYPSWGDTYLYGWSVESATHAIQVQVKPHRSAKPRNKTTLLVKTRKCPI